MQSIEELIKKEFEKSYTKQKEFYELLKLEFEVLNLENNLERVKEVNLNLEQQIRKYQREIDYFKSRIHRISQEQQYYLKEYNKILHSTSWKLMAPMRAFGLFFKKVSGR